MLREWLDDFTQLCNLSMCIKTKEKQEQKQKQKQTNFYNVILDDSGDNYFRKLYSLHRWEKQCAMSVFLSILSVLCKDMGEK